VDEIPLVGATLQQLQHSKPHGGNASGKGHLLTFAEFHQALGVQKRPGITNLLPTITAACGSPHESTWNMGTTGRSTSVELIPKLSPTSVAME